DLLFQTQSREYTVETTFAGDSIIDVVGHRRILPLVVPVRPAMVTAPAHRNPHTPGPGWRLGPPRRGRVALRRGRRLRLRLAYVPHRAVNDEADRAPEVHMPTYTLRQLEYLVAVADAGSISPAAGALHVTPPAVASAITELERTLHTQLMVRRKAHGVVLTPTGTFLYNRATTLLRDAEELQLATASGGAELVGPLVLGCYATLAPTIVPTLMRWVAEQHPS